MMISPSLLAPANTTLRPVAARFGADERTPPEPKPVPPESGRTWQDVWHATHEPSRLVSTAMIVGAVVVGALTELVPMQEGWKSLTDKLVLFGALPLGALSALNRALIGRSLSSFKSDPLPAESEILWPANTSVLASSSQNNVGLGGNSFHKDYSDSLVAVLRKPEVSGLEDAQNVLAATGYRPIPLAKIKALPVLRRLDTWQKSEKNPFRYILSIHDGQDKPMTKSATRALKAFQEIYGIPAEQIESVSQLELSRIAEAAARLVQKIPAEARSQAEVMIYMSCHGVAVPSKTNDEPRKEGSMTYGFGHVGSKLIPESSLYLISRVFQQIPKVSIILDSCHSGAAVNLSAEAKAKIDQLFEDMEKAKKSSQIA